MIIAYGILIPAILVFIVYIAEGFGYNQSVKSGEYTPKEYYSDSDEKVIFISYLLILCCSQYIWG